MKKTYREKLISSCNRTVKKHKWLKNFMMLYMMTAIFCYHIGLNLVKNAKRYSCAALLILLAVTSSSFAKPDGLHALQQLTAEEDGVKLLAEQEVNPEEVASIEADDSEDYDDTALPYEEEPDTYTLDEILESNVSYKDMVQDNTDKKEDTEEYTFDEDDWRLILINKQHSVPEDYTFPLGTITGSMQCDERILEDLLAMMQAAKKDGVNLVICSPYRDYNRQTYLFEKKITRYMNAGMSYMDAYKTASVTVTSPNASEHRIGLAIDFYSNTYKSLDEGFADTETGKWLAVHSSEYGFILRYPKGKEFITGIEYEPWHFRYVGKEAATVITESAITLEEFWEDL